jgi:hypothetical protein
VRQALLLLMVPEPGAAAAKEPAAQPPAPEDAEEPPGIEDATPGAPQVPASVDPPAQARSEPEDQERLDKARKLLQEAIRRSQSQGPAPAPGGLRPFPGMKVDKYFGTKLPPVCASLGCYVTDDGKRFYCVNPACQKHKKRETKHTRRGNPAKAHFVYFRCPRCESRSLEMHVLSNRYVCRACKYSWQR